MNMTDWKPKKKNHFSKVASFVNVTEMNFLSFFFFDNDNGFFFFFKYIFVEPIFLLGCFTL